MNIQKIISKLRSRLTQNKTEISTPVEDLYELRDTRNVFVDSIGDITADDFAPAPPPISGGDRAREWIRRGIMAVCACVFIASAGSLVQKLADYQRGDEIYGDIAENIFNTDLAGNRAVATSSPSRENPAMLDYYTSLTENAEEISDSNDSSYNVKFEQMKANLTYLKSLNPDIYGYIHIDGTRISFPIVQGRDNEYYLERAYNNEYMVCGSIYADYQADRKIINNRNTVFYGHNMLDGNMFNNVMLFLDEAVFNSKVIEIYTFDGIYTYEPFAIFKTVYTYQYFRMNFSSDADFIAFCEEMQSKSEHNKNMTFTGDDRVITLSTCTSSDDPASYYVGRYALHAKLIKVEQ